MGGKKELLTFENVSSNIICSDITGEQKLLDLVLKITPENLEAVNTAYKKIGKLKVVIHLGK